MVSFFLLLCTACAFGQNWQVFGPDTDANPNTFQCKDPSTGKFVEAYNCDKDGRDANGMTAAQRGAVVAQERNDREKFGVADYNKELADSRARRTKHSGYVADFDRMLQDSKTTESLRSSIQMARKNAGLAVDMENRRLSDNAAVFPESSYNGNDAQNKFLSNYKAQRDFVNSRSFTTGDGSQSEIARFEQVNRRQAQARAMELMSADEIKTARQDLRNLEQFRARQVGLRDKFSSDAAVKGRFDANIAGATSRIDSLRGINGVGIRTKARSDAQMARMEQVQNMWKARMYDPAWASKRSQVQRNIDRVERARDRFSKLKYDSKGRLVSTDKNGSIAGQM